MALTKEDLQAIKGIVDDSVSGLKEDVSGLKESVSSLEERVGGLEESVSALQDDMSLLNNKADNLENEVRIIKVDKLENGALKILNEMAQNYSDTYQRYRNGADKFEVAFIDIDNLKKTVTKHSKQIKKLQKA